MNVLKIILMLAVVVLVQIVFNLSLAEGALSGIVIGLIFGQLLN